jgi:hypothetical protein
VGAGRVEPDDKTIVTALERGLERASSHWKISGLGGAGDNDVTSRIETGRLGGIEPVAAQKSGEDQAAHGIEPGCKRMDAGGFVGLKSARGDGEVGNLVVAGDHDPAGRIDAQFAPDELPPAPYTARTAKESRPRQRAAGRIEPRHK